ncbi:MAG: helix-turn-helix domain-containing protein [Candidatus Magnetoovum sp. WYHC-5]|nr:helix-turn-helix domain-containing protein [Candidatus Magnetoovum sp. WYHC-5]
MIKRIVPPSDKQILTSGEACGYLGVSWNTLKKVIDSGELRVKRVGSRYIFTKVVIDEYLERDKFFAKALLRSVK